jgi:hypothetical protein
MPQQNTLTTHNDEKSDSFSWQQVLEFGAEFVTEKVTSQPQKMQTSVLLCFLNSI